MEAYTIRPARRNDEPVLKKIWKICFRDSDAQTELFFKRFFLKGENAAFVAETDGGPAGAAYSLQCGELVSADGSSRRCPYIYGVGVLPEARRCGMGARLTIAAAGEEGGMSVLVPSDPEFFGYYGNSGFSTSFRCRTLHVRACDRAAAEVLKISAERYAAEREAYLTPITHIKWNADYLAHFEALCGNGGGLFSLNGGSGLAAAEMSGGKLIIKEMLCPHGEEVAYGSALASRYGSAECSIQLFSAHGTPFGMSRPAIAHPAWFGLALD